MSISWPKIHIFFHKSHVTKYRKNPTNPSNKIATDGSHKVLPSLVDWKRQIFCGGKTRMGLSLVQGSRSRSVGAFGKQKKCPMRFGCVLVVVWNMFIVVGIRKT